MSAQTEQATLNDLPTRVDPSDLPERPGAPRHRDLPEDLDAYSPSLLEYLAEWDWSPEDIAQDLTDDWTGRDVVQRYNDYGIGFSTAETPHNGSARTLFRVDPEDVYDWGDA